MAAVTVTDWAGPAGKRAAAERDACYGDVIRIIEVEQHREISETPERKFLRLLGPRSPKKKNDLLRDRSHLGDNYSR